MHWKSFFHTMLRKKITRPPVSVCDGCVKKTRFVLADAWQNRNKTETQLLDSTKAVSTLRREMSRLFVSAVIIGSRLDRNDEMFHFEMFRNFTKFLKHIKIHFWSIKWNFVFLLLSDLKLLKTRLKCMKLVRRTWSYSCMTNDTHLYNNNNNNNAKFI